jgi:NADH-quinone oxidoreductase subunit J
MLLNVPREDAAEYDRSHPLNRPGARRFGAILTAALAVELVWALSYMFGRGAAMSDTAAGSVSSVREIGRVLFSDYAFPFEVTSILILAAMVGAIVLAKPEGQ